jgi:hypothetical protein
MTDIARVRFSWTGFTGAPGVSTFFADDAAAVIGPLRAFFTSVAGYLPSSVHIDSPTDGDIIDDATGALTGTYSHAAGTTLIGTASDFYAGPVGACINWITGVVLDGHRVKGRTFLVPLTLDGYDSDGTLADAYRTGLQTAVGVLLADAAGHLKIWHRPLHATLSHGARAGGSATVVAAQVPDLAAVLRSRRG